MHTSCAHAPAGQSCGQLTGSSPASQVPLPQPVVVVVVVVVLVVVVPVVVNVVAPAKPPESPPALPPACPPPPETTAPSNVTRAADPPLPPPACSEIAADPGPWPRAVAGPAGIVSVVAGRDGKTLGGLTQALAGKGTARLRFFGTHAFD